MDADGRCGLVALVGRPNVGKSTLLNRLVGQKVSIVTPRPQTTRHRVAGILTEPRGQAVFIDTPGLHRHGKRHINRYMNRAAASATADADVVVWVVEALRLDDEDEKAIESLPTDRRAVGVAINMVDRVARRDQLLPFIEALNTRRPFAFLVPLSATTGEGCDALLDELFDALPPGPALYPEDQFTDRSERFQAAETVREKLMTRMRDEVPYGITVEIERFEEKERLTAIGAVIWVEREGHRGIVIGKGGAMLREVGTAARLDLERMLGRPVHLQLWVKVREGWADDEGALRRFGYE